MTKSDEVDRLVSATVDAFGGIDIAVNNAGTYQMASLEETTDEIWERHLAANTTSVFYCMRRIVPEMKRRGGGKLIQTGRSSARVAPPTRPPTAPARSRYTG